MIVLPYTKQLKIDEPSVVAVGKFDGGHLGHRRLLTAMKEISEEEHLKIVLFTVLREDDHLLTDQERREVFGSCGADLIIEARFSDIREIEPEDFVREILVERLHMKAIVAGPDCRFGKKARGDARLLTEMGEEYGFSVTVVEKLTDSTGQEISSTYIKELIRNGELKKASVLLDREISESKH